MLKPNILFGLVLLSVVLSGCTIPGQAGADAIAVWQHKGNSWDIYYSIWDHDAKAWHVPGGGVSAPIVADLGDDHDPDVSSNDIRAVAVWAKSGSGIYYSIWENMQWKAPLSLSDSALDQDPTVAVDASGNALAVWVSNANSLSYSYFKDGIGWTSPSKLNTSKLSKVSLPELSYNPTDGYYYLVFTAYDVDGSAGAYAAAYGTSAGWSAPGAVSQNAVLDNKVPTDQRTGASSAEGISEVTIVWPGPGNKVYSTRLSGNASSFADGEMPDVAYDSNDSANGVYSDDEDLFHQPDVHSPGSESTVSGLKNRDDRASIAFIRDRSVGLTVWWTKVVSPGQIYYSYYENGQWIGVSQIDPSLSRELDRNPAVTPLRSLAPEEELGEGYCGDKVIQPPEQCELGVACPNPNDVCLVPPCVCKPRAPPPPNETLDCSMNSFPGIFGFSLFMPGMMCKDDCKAAFGDEWECDMKTCKCSKKPKPPPENVSCADNTVNLPIAGNSFGPGMICKDDCWLLDSDMECDMQTCVCREREKPPRNVSCASNTWDEALGAPSFGPGMICKDDCQVLLGSEWECNIEACVCEEKEDTAKKCAGHTREVSRTDVNNFDASVMTCEDNCDELGEDYECNVESCTCTKKQVDYVSCGQYTAESMWDFTGEMTQFDPATMQCRDDCKEYFGMPDVVCDPETCLCEPATLCAENTDDTIWYMDNVHTSAMQCIDNCDSLGEGYACDVGACVCRKSEGYDVYCAANTDDAFLEGVEKKGTHVPFDATAHQCIDNCEVFGDAYTCNVETCYCEPTNISEQSCSINTQYVDATDRNPFNPSAMQCKDDCEEGWGEDYECNVESCTCVKKKDEYSCFSNYFVSIFPGTNESGYDPSSDICIDNCDEGGEAFGMDMVCNMQSCMCEPVMPCDYNTLDTVTEGSNAFAGSGLKCQDTCAALGEGWYCDMEPCVCRRKPDTEVYCGANTGEAYITRAINVGSTPFDPSTMICKDNCEEAMGPDSKCDMSSCVCVPDDGVEVSCTVHTDHVDATDTNAFNANTMQCIDDCEELGPGYVCNAESCTCTKGPEEILCSSRVAGQTTTISAVGKKCVDDCAEALGPEYQCNVEGCYCEKTGEEAVPTFSCYNNTEAGVTPPEQFTCIDDCAEYLGTDYYCSQMNCQCYPKVEAVCGDGIIGVGEDCDWGSANTNKCEQAEGETLRYCTESCECKEIEHTPRCGDGKITPPEGCDGGNVKTNICPEGYTCYTPECTCIPQEGSGQCGDGTVTPPEECDHGNTFTEKCPAGLYCQECRCVEYQSTYHMECDYELEKCVKVTGPGEDLCSSDSQCAYEEEEEEEAFCGNNEREGYEECDGTDDSACSEDQYCNQYCQCTEIPASCGDGKVDAGEECESDSQCNEDAGEVCYNCQCIAPPSVDCTAYCFEQGYTESLGGYSSGEACSEAAGESEEQCKVKCIYVHFSSWSNPAGEVSCCCKDKYTEDCNLLPGGGCECPDKETVDNQICPAHAPG
ncbi:hypothetical protein GF318_02650 [Candidatus Micrarchaeota archaeon]|nr:hypothetical protein [Candidatus Micrarchaeota archaeon]